MWTPPRSCAPEPRGGRSSGGLRRARARRISAPLSWRMCWINTNWRGRHEATLQCGRRRGRARRSRAAGAAQVACGGPAHQGFQRLQAGGSVGSIQTGGGAMKRLCLVSLLAVAALAQVPTPESVLGHKPGDDFYLATYEDALGYFRKLAAASNRIKLVNVGKTTQGRDWFKIGRA